MDLTTSYLGFELPHPFFAGASPLVEDLDTVRRLEDAGAAMIVLPSLFEEQVTHERHHIVHHMEIHKYHTGEALSYFPEPEELRLGPENYLDHLSRVKGAVEIPVVASLNGLTDSGWLNYAKMLEEAGADALELNVYFLATDDKEDSAAVEQKVVDVTWRVKSAVRVPVAVKLSPFYSSLANMAQRLVGAGADGLILFNRFFHPDIDIEEIELKPTLELSDPSELPLRLAWLGILSGHVKASLAVTGGVHGVGDAIKAVMSGADAVQMVSAVLKNGPGHITAVRDGVAAWLEQHEYESLAQMKGSMNLMRCPDPAAYERANYMRMLQRWRG
jgi:dihydroorotate dehydrogenase (fumarate)